MGEGLGRQSVSVFDIYVVYNLIGLVRSRLVSTRIQYLKGIASVVREKTQSQATINIIDEILSQLDEVEPVVINLEKQLEFIRREYELGNVFEPPKILKQYSALETQIAILTAKILRLMEKTLGETPVSILKMVG